MEPLVKWIGGKSGELGVIRPLIEDAMNNDLSFTQGRFIEPFFGGGAVYFDVEPSRGVINDINPDLINLYTVLSNNADKTKLKKEINKIIKDRSEIDKLAVATTKPIFNKYYKKNRTSDTYGDKQLKLDLESYINSLSTSFNKELKQVIVKQITNKIKRVKGLEIKEDGWKDQNVMNQIMTAWHAGYYTWQRDRDLPDNKYESTANFLYLREFCYAGMFRYNREDKFNIPYGGFSYNQKDFQKKIDRILSTDVTKLLAGSKIYSESFETLLSKIKPTKNDFMFLDPPYDFVFSDYQNNTFGKQEQELLAKEYGKLDCKALVIISDTPFIRKIYNAQKKVNPKIKIISYDKLYTYNIKGRVDGNVQHLAITNW